MKNLKKILFIIVAVIGLASYAKFASAATINIPIAERPTFVPTGPDIGVITFPAGSALKLVPYDLEIIKQEGQSVTVRISPESTLTFYDNKSGKWVFVKDGGKYLWSKGIASNPTAQFGGTAENGASLKLITN